MESEDKKNYWEEEQEEVVEPISTPAPQPEDIVTWTAQEYIHQDKSPVWFIVIIVVALGLIAVDFFILKSWTFSALVIVMTIALFIYSRRPPRTLTYGLSGKQGLSIGEKIHHYDEFKAFGFIKDGEHNSIMLIPVKRFAPGVSVYFPEEVGEKIVDILGQRLPMENLKLDIMDVVIRKLRL